MNKPNLKGKIDIEIHNKENYLEFFIVDNGMGFNNLKNKTASEWREYAIKCMAEILDHKTKA